MCKEAFGGIGIEPEKFYRMDIDDFWLLRDGWNDKLIYEQSVIRRQTALLAEIHIGTGKGIKFVIKNWPLPFDKKGSTRQRAYDLLKQFKEQEAIKKVKKQLSARRSKDTDRG